MDTVTMWAEMSDKAPMLGKVPPLIHSPERYP